MVNNPNMQQVHSQRAKTNITIPPDIIQNHPYRWKQKTALAAGLVFLEVYGISIMYEIGELDHAAMRIAL